MFVKIFILLAKFSKQVLIRNRWPWIVAVHGLVVLLVLFLLHVLFGIPLEHRLCDPYLWSETLDNGFEGFDNVNGVPNGRLIVPNYIHFLRYGANLQNVNFMDAVCILSAFKNQKPDKLFFHTNLSKFSGKHWERLMQVPGFKETIEFRYIEPVESVFGQQLSSWYKLWHGSDILRIDILSRFGGIFVDNDVYVVRNMDELRKYEMTVELNDWKSFGTMTLVAHKDARFLRLWLNSYRQYYGHLWYYNAGEKPKLEVLDVRPELVHNVQNKLGVLDLRVPLYIERWKDWKSQFTIHTLIRHLHDLKELTHNSVGLKYPVVFNEKNILEYNVTIQDMVLDCCRELVS